MTDVFAVADPLALPEPPGEADLHPVIATEGAKRVAERNAAVVDPQISPRDRLLVGARLIAGNQGADRATLAAWQRDRTQPTPPRSGTDPRQAAILAAPDNFERGKVLGAGAAAWLEATGADPVDVARFDRAAKTGRAAELWDKMLSGGFETDDEAFILAEKVANVGRMLEDFDDDLTVGGGRVVDVGDKVRVHWSEEPAPGVITALGLDSLPVDAFDGDVDEGFDAIVGDDIVVAAPVESQALLRRAFPAASAGKTPRWLSVQPAKVTSVLGAVDSAGFDPAANVAVHLAGHPGLAPYDSIVFTTPTDRRADRFTARGARRVERGLVSTPRYARRQVASTDLVDGPTAEKLIDETAWAIFPDGVDHPGAIPVRNEAGGDGVIVFGIEPDEAAELAPTFAYVNDGIAIESGYDGLEPFGVDPAWFELDLLDGSTHSFPVARDEALLQPERQQRAVERWEIPLSDKRHVAGMVSHLETLGAADVAAYVTGGVDGFTEAREVLWGDGTGSVVSSRVAGLRSGPNVVPVWVRDSSGLPIDSAVDDRLVDTSEAEAQAERVGDRWRIDATESEDVAAAVRAGHELAQRYGYDNIEVVTARGPLELVR